MSTMKVAINQTAKRSFAFFLTLFGLLVFFGAQQAQAQELQASSEATPAVFVNPPANAQIASIRELYAQQVLAYQTAERQFLLAKSQHEKLQSLSSLEEAVQANQIVLQKRTDVLLSYADLLYATLQDTLGLELSYKEAQSKQLESTIVELRQFRKNLETANTRTAVLEASVTFEPLFVRIKEDSEKTRSLIAVGRMQLVYDKAQIIYGDIKKFQEEYEVSTLKLSQRERAFAEIDRQFDATRVALRESREEVAGQKGVSSYTSATAKLLAIGSNLSRILGYLDEVLRT